MKKITILILVLIPMSALAFWGDKPVQSWKLYKESVASPELFLMLDMRYFGNSIEEEECNRLRVYYSELQPKTKFYCMLNANDPADEPIPKP